MIKDDIFQSETHYNKGLSCINAGQIDEAIQFFHQALALNPHLVEAHCELAQLFMLKHHEHLAMAHYHQAIQMNPSFMVPYVKLGHIYLYKLQYQRALDFFQQGLLLATEQDALGQKQQVQPSIFLNTLPKSGSIYLLNALKDSLGLTAVTISSKVFFPDDVINPLLFERFLMEPSLTQEHLPARQENLAFLNLYLNKWIIHVRDPRQALVSWYYFFPRETGWLKIRNKQYIDEGYYNLSGYERISWQIEHHLPRLVNWLMQWVKASQRNDLKGKILFTRFEDLKRRSEWFFYQILDFYGLDKHTFTLPESPEKGQLHYRKGKIDEWRSILDHRQQELINAKVPDELLEFFNWER